MSLPPRLEKIPKHIQAIIFDLDGTLVDTEIIAFIALRRVLEDFSHEMDDDDFNLIHGKAWPVVLDLIQKKYPIPTGMRGLATAIEKMYMELIDTESPAIPGAVDCVKRLAKKYPLALVTGSSQKQIDYFFEKLDVMDCFKTALGIEAYLQSKPKPTGFLIAAQRLGIAPENILVFEDSRAGLTGAASAGMVTAWVTLALPKAAASYPCDYIVHEYETVRG